MVGQKTLSHLLLIGLGRFRILGWGARFRILGMPGRGAKSQQAHDVVTTSMRRNDVASTSFRRHVPSRFLINQCQIITFLILKYDIENSRIELRGIVLPVPSNEIKVTFIIVGGLFGGGGGDKGYVGPPPLLNYWVGAWPPSTYAYGLQSPMTHVF